MSERTALHVESTSIQTHLLLVQRVIERMAENSRSCKVWCVTVISAMLVLMARTDESQFILLALVPVLIFCLLDLYYLALERAFRDSYSSFVRKLHTSRLSLTDLYHVKPTCMGPKRVMRCLGSVSIWMFYPLISVTILVIWRLLS